MKFFANRRNTLIHLGLDKALLSFENFKLFLDEIENFLSEQLINFGKAFPPKLALSAKWKHGYIIFQKKKLMAEDKKLTWQFDNEFIPTYFPSNAKRDGFET